MKTRRTVSTMGLVACCVLLAGSVLFADDPNDQSGICYSTFGETETSGPCPSWFTALDRNSTDAYTDLRLVVELDACQIIAYDVNSIEQGTPTPVTVEMEKDDIFIVWDEDAGHGSNIDFNYTNNAYVTDPNISYVQVSTTPDNTIINWVVYQVTENGTLTINDTGLNEHDVIHFYRNHIYFDKDDGIEEPNCVSPADEITYTICWENSGVYPYDDCYIIDWLPKGVTYPGGSWQIIFDPNMTLIPPDPSYDSETHSYAYLDLGTIAVNDANCVTLDVVVNDKAEPGMYLHNVADLYSGDTLIARATVDTRVCCWDDTDPNIIYVDWTAEGDNNGTDWINAYTDLADAIRRATDSNCVSAYTIYVAQGIYDPNNTPNMTFALPDECRVYGGFKSGGCTFTERNPKKYETILTGLIDEETLATSVLTMGAETLLDGFTVTQSLESAVYGNGVDFSVENCKLQENYEYGLYAKNGNVIVKWCKIQLNESSGIRHEGEGATISVDNCWLLRNGEYGIYCLESTPQVRNSVVSESSLKVAARSGIHIVEPTSQPKLYNNTISNNRGEGVSLIHSDPNYFLEENSDKRLDIQNCIVYFNNNNGLQFTERLYMNLDRVAHYSCIQDCNEVNYNINVEPEFAYTVDPNGTPDPNNYHLASESVCKEKGSPSLSYTNQVDMDNKSRMAGTYVDIGADEVDCENVSNTIDWNADGLVNLAEFSKFQKAWLSHDPNDPADPNLLDPNDFLNWNLVCNLDDTGDSQYVIDLADLDAFWDQWLWKACWKDDGLYEMMGMSGGSESMIIAMPSMESATLESTSIESFEEVDPYAEMSNPELALFVKGIFEVIDAIELEISQDHENAENLLEAKEFLEDVLSDIKVSQQ